MSPINELNWIRGLRAGYKSLGAEQKEQYSWLARTADSFVFNAEIDHMDAARNRYDFEAGTFHKQVPPLSVKGGDNGLTVRHAQELLDAVSQAYSSKMKCGLLLLRGTRSGTTKGGIKSAADPGHWVVDELSGDVCDGFNFKLSRIS